MNLLKIKKIRSRFDSNGLCSVYLNYCIFGTVVHSATIMNCTAEVASMYFTKKEWTGATNKLEMKPVEENDNTTKIIYFLFGTLAGIVITTFSILVYLGRLE